MFRLLSFFLPFLRARPAPVAAGTSAPAPATSTWPGATVWLVGLLLAAGLAFYVVVHITHAVENTADLPARVLSGLDAAFRPNIVATTEIRTAIGTLNHEAKLVVLTANIDAEIDKTSATNWGYVYWGTTRVSLRAHDNKIQYVIPLAGIKESAFVYDEPQRRFTLTVPPPALDESMVDVQSDPRQIEVETGNGWAKFDRWSGEPLRQEARQDLRAAVLSVGNHELLQREARDDAKTALTKLLTPFAKNLAPGVTLDIRFAEPPALESPQ